MATLLFYLTPEFKNYVVPQLGNISIIDALSSNTNRTVLYSFLFEAIILSGYKNPFDLLARFNFIQKENSENEIPEDLEIPRLVRQ